MAFIRSNWSRQTSALNTGDVTVSGAPVSGPAIFTYHSETDLLATIAAADYFTDAVYDLSINDFLYLVGSDTVGMFVVSTFDRNTGSVELTNTSLGGTVTASSTDTFTNKTFDANGTGNSITNIDVADLANGTDGELITWDASGVAATVAVGTATYILTSNGPGTAPTFQASGLDIGALSELTVLDGTEEFVVDSSAVNKKTTLNTLNNSLLTSQMMPRRTNYYYAPDWAPGSVSTTTTGLNSLVCTLASFPLNTSVTRIGIHVNAGGTAGKSARLGAYTVGSDGRPDTLIEDFGEVATDSSGEKEITISRTFSGPVFFAVILEESTSLSRAFVDAAHATNHYGTAAYNGADYCSFTQSMTYGVLPDPFVVSSENSGSSITIIWTRTV